MTKNEPLTVCQCEQTLGAWGDKNGRGGRRGRRGLRRTPKTLARCMSASRARTAPVRKSDAIAVGISRRDLHLRVLLGK